MTTSGDKSAGKARKSTKADNESQSKQAPAKKRTTARKAAATRPLTAKQSDFVREYLIDLNGTRAYMRAFPGVTEGSARTLAARTLANVRIQDEIAKQREKSAEKLDLTREAVLAQYQRLAFSDVRKMFHPQGGLKHIHELDDDTAAAITGFEVEMRLLDGPDMPPVPVLKVKWADKRGALDSIMKAQAWNKTDIGNEDNPLTSLLKTLGQRSALPVVLMPTGEGAESGSTLPMQQELDDEDD